MDTAMYFIIYDNPNWEHSQCSRPRCSHPCIRTMMMDLPCPWFFSSKDTYCSHNPRMAETSRVTARIPGNDSPFMMFSLSPMVPVSSVSVSCHYFCSSMSHYLHAPRQHCAYLWHVAVSFSASRSSLSLYGRCCSPSRSRPRPNGYPGLHPALNTSYQATRIEEHIAYAAILHHRTEERLLKHCIRDRHRD